MSRLSMVPADVDVSAVAFSAAGDRFAAAAGNTVVIAGRRGDDARAVELPVGGDKVAYALAFSPDGARLAVSYRTPALFILDVATGETVARLPTRGVGHSSLVWSPDGAYLIAGQFEPFITIFDVASQKRRYVLSPDIFDDEGNTVVTFVGDALVSTAGNKVCVWPYAAIMAGTVKVEDMDALGMVPRVKPKKLGRSGYGHVVDVVMSPDRVVALETTQSEWNLLQLGFPGGDSLARAIKLPRFALHLARTADPDLVAVSEPCDRGIVLWSLSRRTALAHELDGAAGAEIRALTSDPSGTMLAAGTRLGVWQWDVRT